MIYAYDLGVQLPINSIYNTQMMLALISAAKDMYEKAELEMKDFKKEYGDFLSPILRDMEWYLLNVTGKMRNTLDDLYARGIDPLRSAEGRYELRKVLNSIDTGTIAKMKQAAINRNAYNASALKDENYNKEFADWAFAALHKGISPDQWSTTEHGIFPEVVAPRFKTMNDIVDPIIKNVDFTYDDAMTREKNDGNDYYTITTDRMMKAFSENLPDIMNTPHGAWYYNQALTATGGDKDAAKALLMLQMADRVGAAERIKKEVDPYKKSEFDARLSRLTHAANAAIDHYYREQESNNDFMRDVELENIKNGGNGKGSEDIFTESVKTAGKPGSEIAGRAVLYELSQQYYLGIDPKFLARSVTVYDEKGGQATAWDFNVNTLKKRTALQYYNSNTGKFEYAQLPDLPEGVKTIRFIPSSFMRSTVTPDSNINARIQGQMFYIDKEGKLHPIYTEDGYPDLWVPVVKRGGNYGLTLKKN